MMRRIATVLVTPKTLLREGLASLLSNTDYCPVACLAALCDVDAVAASDAERQLFVIGADALPPGGAEAVERQLSALRHRFPASRTIVLSDCLDVEGVVSALRAGAGGYLMCTMSVDALIKAFDVVMQGETVLASEFSAAVSGVGSEALAAPGQMAPHGAPHCLADALPQPLVHAVPPARSQAKGRTEAPNLSSRETAILTHLMEGHSNKSIARGIGVAEATVKTHIKAILRKIRVRNRTQAALWAFTNFPAGSAGPGAGNGRRSSDDEAQAAGAAAGQSRPN